MITPYEHYQLSRDPMRTCRDCQKIWFRHEALNDDCPLCESTDTESFCWDD